MIINANSFKNIPQLRTSANGGGLPFDIPGQEIVKRGGTLAGAVE